MMRDLVGFLAVDGGFAGRSAGGAASGGVTWKSAAAGRWATGCWKSGTRGGEVLKDAGEAFKGFLVRALAGVWWPDRAAGLALNSCAGRPTAGMALAVMDPNLGSVAGEKWWQVGIVASFHGAAVQVSKICFSGAGVITRHQRQFPACDLCAFGQIIDVPRYINCRNQREGE